jgi:hypothetical protein
MDLEPLTTAELVTELRRRWIPTRLEVISAPPRAGTIVRSSWDEFSRLVLVVSATDREVVGHPLELGRGLGGDELVYLQSELTTMSVPMMAYAAQVSFPAVIFDAVVGYAVDDWATKSAQGITPLTTSERSEQLFRDVTEFLDSWVPQTQSPTVVEIFAGANVTPTQIAGALQIPIPVALRLRRGQRTLTPEEAAQLTSALRIPEEALARATAAIPMNLREALSGAKYRSAMERIRERLGSFTDAFNDLAVGALSAARSDVSEPEWEDRIDRYIEASES